MKKPTKRKKTVSNLEMWIQMTILGLIANPEYSKLGKFLAKTYKEDFEL